VAAKDFKKLKIAVVMGGLSAERRISLITGRAIYSELKKHGHNVHAININSRSIRGLLKLKPDVVINGLHGTYGEDGVMQGILEFFDIPYAGSGVLGSAVAMNKVMAKEIMRANGILTPKWQVIGGIPDLRMGFPVVFKPEAEGSAVGVYIVKNKKEAVSALAKTAKSGRVLAEEYIKGTEISVPVLAGKALPAIEIIPKNEFYDYDAKYTPGKSEHIIPARLPKKALREAAATAVKTHNVLRCRDFSRIDMIYRKGRLYVLEANTLPGMTGVSLFPESAAAAGISFYGLIKILVKEALRRKR